jgi:hypothetical protein
MVLYIFMVTFPGCGSGSGSKCFWKCWIRIRILAIYAPLIYTALRADPLRGQVGGGWALEIETFGLCELALSR